MRRISLALVALALTGCAQIELHCERCTVFPEGFEASGLLGGLMGQVLAPKPEPKKPVEPALPKREDN